jgi:hypothetical protein
MHLALLWMAPLLMYISATAILCGKLCNGYPLLIIMSCVLPFETLQRLRWVSPVVLVLDRSTAV